MDRIEKIIKLIEEKPGIYIGKKSVDRLAHFLSGYECAIADILQERPCFNSQFQSFLEETLGLEWCTEHWSSLISKNRTEEEAFFAFFEYFDKMTESRKTSKK